MAEPIALDEIKSMARAHAPDFYLTALLAPTSAQADLLALAAFLGDVERIVTSISEPAIAEIRLQWWREAIEGARGLIRSGHPIADALCDAIVHRDLPYDAFDGFLDARALDLYADPIPNQTALEAYLTKGDGAAFALAAACLGETNCETSPLIRQTAIAYGLARLIRRLSIFLSRGRSPFPPPAPGSKHTDAIAEAARQARQGLVEARALWRSRPRSERAACLPLALVEPYLQVACAAKLGPTVVTDLAPLARIWALTRAYLRGCP